MDDFLLERFFKTTQDIDLLKDDIWSYEDFLENIMEDVMKKVFSDEEAFNVLEDLILKPVSEGKFSKMFSKKHLLWMSQQIFEKDLDKNKHVFFIPEEFSKAKQVYRCNMPFTTSVFVGIPTNKGLVYLVESELIDGYLFLTAHFLDRFQERLNLKNRKEAMRTFIFAMSKRSYALLNWKNGSSRFFFSTKNNIGLGLGHHIQGEDCKRVLLTTYVSEDLLKDEQKQTFIKITREHMSGLAIDGFSEGF